MRYYTASTKYLCLRVNVGAVVQQHLDDSLMAARACDYQGCATIVLRQE